MSNEVGGMASGRRTECQALVVGTRVVVTVTPIHKHLLDAIHMSIVMACVEAC